MNADRPEFHDHFSGHAGAYAAHRPSYPPELFEWLAGQCARTSLAWDCATGNGQAAVALARYFDQVVASDASRAQIEQACSHPAVSYRVEPAEQSALAPGSADLITVAQAWHWFDHAAFAREARRVLRPSGVLAIWTYLLAQIEPDVDALVFELYDAHLGAYWPPERRYIEREYRDANFAWPELEAPRFEIRVDWTLAETLAYLGTWSALRRFVEKNGANPLDPMHESFADAWGDPEEVKTVRWPLVVRAWRKVN